MTTSTFYRQKLTVVEARLFPADATAEQAAELAAWCGGEVVTADTDPSFVGEPPHSIWITSPTGGPAANRGDYLLKDTTSGTFAAAAAETVEANFTPIDPTEATTA